MKKSGGMVENYFEALGLQLFAYHAEPIEAVDGGLMALVALQPAQRGCQFFGSAHFHAVADVRDVQRGSPSSLRAKDRHGGRYFRDAAHWDARLIEFILRFPQPLVEEPGNRPSV